MLLAQHRCLSWPSSHRNGDGGQAITNSSFISTTQIRRPMLIEQGEGVSRLPSNHRLLRPQSLQRPKTDWIRACMTTAAAYAFTILFYQSSRIV